ncbi:hypothetical protein [Alteromonas macleodii]|uniref:Uncharacterized protein n=1 Tax=Alteromonas macleodii TaxID=28108 RepID=A0AB36FUE4_ALTMA|nr:hypothetical protein [Alteromonas macleodii]OES30915.1 hypothetical protein BFV93_2266 [Alteromonas macleodii]OES31444.1 hypothetical protein BFV95_2273 [Alteromonas macleodii]OES31774.1 hypothetical protein BFV94_2271 [Alteromonas macleodii]OES41111.1 hypothetical protein BFV96_2259 [Alteromonas macleodii]
MVLSDTLQLTMLMILIMGTMAFYMGWRQSQRENRKFKEEELRLRRYEIDSNSRAATINVENTNEAQEEEKTDLNGYVFMTVDENKKSIFSEMLKGFEDYAKLKGYKASLSIDTSIKGKVGFKFTLHEEGVSVSTQKVKSDINDYINTVMSGGDFDDMPVLITPEEHSAVIGTLKARLKFMEYTHALEQENKEFYQSLISKMANSSVSNQPANINLIQEGIGMDSRSYSANNSANVVQGDDNTNLIENSTVQVGKNVAEINSQLDLLKEALGKIEAESTQNESLKPVVRHLENVKEELEESSTPDSSIIEKWLGKANSAIKTARATTETLSKFQGVLESFGVSF